MPQLRSAIAAEVPTEVLYGLLRLRAEIYIIEQRSLYVDPDGRDLEEATIQFWAEEGGRVISGLRLLQDAGERRIGRVVTAVDHRGRGLAGRLMAQAIAAAAGQGIVLDAQAHLSDWYAAMGFEAVGEVYDLDGIPHQTMRRAA